MRVLDFRPKSETVGIVQPGFKIQGYDVEISLKRDDFRIEVGCQRVTITSKNIDQLLAEMAGEKKEDQLIKVIVPKGSTKEIKSIKSVARFLEESSSFYVSASKKLYDKTLFEIKEQVFQMPNDYFVVNAYGTVTFNGYSVNKTEVEKLFSILTTIKNYYESLEASVQEEDRICESEEAILSEDKCQ